MSPALDQSADAVIDEMESVGFDVGEDSQHRLVRVVEKNEYQLLLVREDDEVVKEIRSAAPFENVYLCTCGLPYQDIEEARYHIQMSNGGLRDTL